MINRFFGFQIKISLSLLILIGLVGISNFNNIQNFVSSITVLTIAFVSIFLHELGHIYAGKYLGFKTYRLVLTMFGGMAEMDDSFSDKAKNEFIIIIAGPLVNLAIMILSFLVYHFWFNPEIPEATTKLVILSWEGFFLTLFTVNLLLIVFNLLPVYPMDGGRILRSALHALNGDFNKATYYTSIISIIVGVTGIVLAFYGKTYIMTAILLGLMVFMNVGKVLSLKHGDKKV